MCKPQPLFTCIHMHGHTSSRTCLRPCSCIIQSPICMGRRPHHHQNVSILSILSFRKHSKPSFTAHLFVRWGHCICLSSVGGNILNSSGLNDTRRSEWGKISLKKTLKCVYFLYLKTTRKVVCVAQAIYIL